VDGTLTASNGVNVTGGTILGAGTLSGSVTVGGSGTTPTISAGDSGKAGLLVITGSYTQLSTATISSFIGGTTVGTQYSQLQVDGTATLAGTLTVKLASGFTPTVGSTFTVLTAGTVTGTFSNSTIAINSSEHFNVSYTSTGVVLTVASGAAAPSGAVSLAIPAIADLKTRQVATNNLRPSNLRTRMTGTPQGGSHLLLAAIGNPPHSGAILVGGYGLTKFGGSDRLPSGTAAHWEHVATGAAPVAQLPSSLDRDIKTVPRSDNWVHPVAGGSSLRLPAAGTLIRRVPVKILAPMLPRRER
jgi:hypothetical protein